MNFNTIMQTFNVVLEIYTPSGLQRQRCSGPRFILEQQFLGVVQQAMESTAPVKIVMKRTEQEWNNFENKNINLDYSITYANPVYLSSHEEEFNENQTES